MRTKKLLCCLLVIAMIMLAMAIMTACGDSTTDSSTESSTPTTPSSTPSSGNGNTKPDVPMSNYTIELTAKLTGKPIKNVDILVYDKEGYLVAQGKTDENGFATVEAPKGQELEVELGNMPRGYVYEEFYVMGSTGLKLELETKVMPNEGGLSNVQYALGDVMYDFEVTTVTGEKIKLSEILKTKKAVMLNFWYTTCTYCIEEFPYIQSAYEQYKDQIEIIGFNDYPSDNLTKVETFLKDFKDGAYTNGEACELTFPMVMDTIGLEEAFATAFGQDVNPCTVIIDRYGIVSMVQVGGVMGERYFTKAFDHYVANDYEQELFFSIYELSPLEKPDVEMPSSDEIKEAVVVGDMNVTFRPDTEGEDAEYSWPFIITEKDGVTCIKSSNYDRDNSWATIFMDVTLEAGQAVVFDYYASTQRLYDVMYVLVDGKDIYAISGMPLQEDDGTLLEDPWKTCCTWVAEEAGTYEVAFCYYKDGSTKAGDDTVYLRNFKVVDKDELDNIEVEAYIPRYAATDKKDDGSFGSYVDIFFNENDGYYHVGNENGPLLLAGLNGVNTQFSLKMPEDERITVTETLTLAGEFIVDGVDRYTRMIMYCNYATNSKLVGYCPVTKELRGYLEAYVKQNDFIVDENTWLQLCSYYDAYGVEGELEDPIKGLTTFSAFDAVVSEGDDNFKNSVTYHQIIMPRGYLYKFVPTKSGVYRITSNSSQEVNGWIFTGTFDQWMDENGGDRILFTDSETGERYCPELLIDPEGDNTFVRDYSNCSMIAYFEEGVEYYIDIAYYDVYATGTFTFDLKYVGETANIFYEASQGVFTFEEGVEDTIAGGINVALCTDENDERYGYYCHKLPNGELGSIVYADFYYTTNIFPSQSIKVLVEQGAFNMKMTELDRDAYAYVKNYYEVGGIQALKDLWGDEFDANWAIYQMDDAIKGIYHGKGPDYTEAMRKYFDKMETGGVDPETGKYTTPERQGCVPVDEELAIMLQALMDKYTFQGVDHSWTKLSYYYKTYGPIASTEEKRAELGAILDNAEITSAEIQTEINKIVSTLDSELEYWTNKYVEIRLIDQAMEKIIVLLEADKANQ